MHLFTADAWTGEIKTCDEGELEWIEKKKLLSYGLKIRVSTESQGMGIYKSFNYEIFERRPSMVIAFDGNSAAANMIQEARNGKGKADIYVWGRSKTLRQKASSLQGYVRIFDEDNPIDKIIQKNSLRN